MNTVNIEYVDNIAIVSISNPPVNALSHSVRDGLMKAASTLDQNPGVEAIVLICDGRTFIAGADIKEFGQPIKEPHLPDVIDRIEACIKPWVAAIHGTALGGGFEVTLGCHYRIGVPTAKAGLPEVHLGLIPGAGGTVRLPRLIPALDAAQLVSTGKLIGAQKALELGIFDEVVSGDDLRSAAIEFAKSIAQKPLPEPLASRSTVQNCTREEWQELTASTTKKARGQLSPVEAVLAIKQSCELGAQDAFHQERERFVKLRDSEQSKALRYVFFAERQTTRIDRIKDTPPLPVNHCGVLGGGTMGAGITAAMLLSGKSVIMVERSQETLDTGLNRVKTIMRAACKRGLINDIKHEKMLSHMNGGIDYSAFAECDLVVEAVFEDMDVKREVFTNLDQNTRQDAILATNTSYLDINEIASCVNDPTRVIGLHFFSPAHIMKLVEVVATDMISDQTLATGFAFAKSLRKVPVLSGVCDGFIANRIMSAYRKECDYMLEDGCTPWQIDAAMKEFGLPMGMFEMADMAGLDIGWATRKRLAPNRDPNERYVKIADRLCELGRFGQKTGAGWYLYDDGSRAGKPDPLVQEIVEEESRLNNIERRKFNNTHIMDRILDAMTREANAVLDEGIAQRPSDIDMVMILGYGFPRWRGGPMFMSGVTG